MFNGKEGRVSPAVILLSTELRKSQANTLMVALWGDIFELDQSYTRQASILKPVTEIKLKLGTKYQKII